MPKGIPNRLGLGPSENTQQLLQAMAELKARLQAEKRKDTTRAALIAFARKHDLDASDLRAAARVLADRKVGDAPVATKVGDGRGNPGGARAATLKPAVGKVGKAIRAARLKANMSNRQIGDRLGCDPAVVQKWQQGANVPEKYHPALLRVLRLPKGILPNGAAVPS